MSHGVDRMRRDSLKALGASAVGAMGAMGAANPAMAADAWPTRPIALIVGFPPGGSNDIVARLIAPTLGRALGTTVIVENRPGANAIVGTDQVARAAPDGYTLTLGSASPLAISPATYPKMPFDTLRDLTAISTVAATAELLTLHPDLPARTLKDIAALSQTRDVTIGSSGNGGLPHLAIELLKQYCKGRIVHVPYKGAGPAINDGLGGHVDGVLVDLPALFTSVKDGRLRPIVATDTRRSSILPDVPTSIEEGAPDLVAVNWFAIMGPAGLPAPIVQSVFAAIRKTMTSPDLIEKLRALGVEPDVKASPAAFADFLKNELVRWGEVARRSGARADA